jgi:hypothetical protein
MNTSSAKPAPLTVGKEIVCYCTRCKMDLGHTITSMVGGMPARVICRTCKSEHNYKSKKGVKEPGAASTVTRSAGTPRAAREPKADKVVPVELEWSKQINASNRAIKQYAANEGFQTGDRLSHPTFGEGVVQKLIFPNKIEVLFRMDIKTLIHAAPKPA